VFLSEYENSTTFAADKSLFDFCKSNLSNDNFSLFFFCFNMAMQIISIYLQSFNALQNGRYQIITGAIKIGIVPQAKLETKSANAKHHFP